MKVKNTSEGLVRHGGVDYAPGSIFEFEGEVPKRLIDNGTLGKAGKAEAAADDQGAAESPAEGTESPDYESMTVAVLRDLLSERGLDTDGLKADLIERLEADDQGAAE